MSGFPGLLRRPLGGSYARQKARVVQQVTHGAGNMAVCVEKTPEANAAKALSPTDYLPECFATEAGWRRWLLSSDSFLMWCKRIPCNIAQILPD